MKPYPRYPVEILEEILPNADFDQLKDIRYAVIADRKNYSHEDFARALVLLANVLININRSGSESSN